MNMHMGESDKSGARLELSVSFGRFGSDDLSWERWSSFSPNKYLEEVGSLSTPGSVAEKKAYFEAHYKKIAAKKAEDFLEQQKSMDNPIEDSSMDAKVGLFDDFRLMEEVVEEVDDTNLHNSSFGNENKDDSDRCDGGVVLEVPTNYLNEVVSIEEGKESPVHELNGSKVDPKLIVENPLKDDSQHVVGNPSERENGVLKPNSLKEEPKLSVKNPSKDDSLHSQHIVDEASGREYEEEKGASSRRDKSKLCRKDVAHKVKQNRKDRAVVPVVKLPSASTPRQAKAKPVSTHTSTSKSWQKKVNGSEVPKGKRFVAAESKGGAETASIHMSMDLGPADSSPMTRKSLIMDKLGDKGIVKRAFKTFYNRTNAFSINTQVQVLSTSTESKISTCLARTNGNAGLRKDSEKIAAQRNQSGSKSKSMPSRSIKSSLTEKKNTTARSQSISHRSSERAEKQKESAKFLTKLRQNQLPEKQKNAQLNAKSKEEKKSEIQKLRQSLNFKAKPLPSFYRVQRKAHLDKEDADNEVHR